MSAGAPSTGVNPPPDVGSPADPKPSPDAGPPAGGNRLRLVLPVVVIAAILAGVTLLLVGGGSSKQTLPGNAGTAKSASFDGSTLEPPQPAPQLSTLRNY